MNEINTINGIYKYQEIKFENGTKRINREISKENLLLLKKCFDAANVNFGLIYGTLLGAVREKNFIEHDEDTDVFVLYEDREKIFNLLFQLRELGFDVGRLNNELMSIIKDGEYIDIYFYKIKNSKTRECDGYVIESNILENLEDYPFLGHTFKVPKNPKKLLTLLYGKNWMIVDKNAKAQNYGLYLRIKFFIRNNSKTLFHIISWIKKRF